jgi:tetratricopeptide (TPR) repeat protein
MATNKRQNILLVGLLLVIITYVIHKEFSLDSFPQVDQVAIQDYPNELILESVEAGKYMSKLFVTYQYNGEFGRNVSVLISPKFDDPSKIVNSDKVHTVRSLKIGKHKDIFQVQSPCRSIDKCAASEVELKIIKSKNYFESKRLGNEINSIPYLYQKSFQKKLEWIVRTQTITEKKKFEDLDLAIWYLDNGSRGYLKSAKKILDKIFVEDPRNVQAYIELARYHMKSSWTELGLKRAEEALNAAYEIDNNYANVFVLRGYVYAHQGKYELAEQDFLLAEKLNTENLWLLANWGEMFQLKGDENSALEYYQLAIEAGMKRNISNNRAKLSAFTRSQDIYLSHGKLDIVDKLIEEKVKQFPKEACYLAEWAELKLMEIGDFEKAQLLARKAISSECQRNKYAKQVYADALVANWYLKSIEGEVENSSFANAVALDANWPKRIYRFARKEKLNQVLLKLLESKVNIDDVDTRGYTALAYAAIDNEAKVVRKLIELGANPNLEIENGYSVFLLSLITSNEETIKAFLDSGAKLNKKFGNNVTVEQLLKERGFDILVSNEDI